MENTFKVSGMEINSVRPSYEHIVISIGSLQDGFKNVYISSETLTTILSEFDFKAVLKRTRHWVEIDIEDYKVERHDEPRI